VKFELANDTMVSAEMKQPLTKSWHTKPAPFKELLAHLEACGHVRIQVHMHTVTRSPGVPSEYDIKATEVCALEATVHEGGGATLAKLSGYVSLPDLQRSELVHLCHRLSFDKNLNKITAGFPGIYAQKPIRISKGQLIKLC